MTNYRFSLSTFFKEGTDELPRVPCQVKIIKKIFFDNCLVNSKKYI